MPPLIFDLGPTPMDEKEEALLLFGGCVVRPTIVLAEVSHEGRAGIADALPAPHGPDNLREWRLPADTVSAASTKGLGTNGKPPGGELSQGDLPCPLGVALGMDDEPASANILLGHEEIVMNTTPLSRFDRLPGLVTPFSGGDDVRGEVSAWRKRALLPNQMRRQQRRQ